MFAATVVLSCKSSPPIASTTDVPANKSVSAKDAGASSCAAKCTGHPSSQLAEWISLTARKSHSCYDKALATTPTLRGKVTVRMRIAADGSICLALGEAEGPMEGVAHCVASFYGAQAHGPAPLDGCTELALPINFVPRSDAADPSRPSYEEMLARAQGNGSGITMGSDLTDAQLSAPMRNATFISGCGAPDSMKVTIKVAVHHGRAVGVSVYTTAANLGDDEVTRCVDTHVRSLRWPDKPEMDSFVTTY